MNRRALLIAACILAAISLGANFWLIWQRQHATPVPAAAEKPAPDLPKAADFDFSGTGLSDEAWKLTDEPKPGVSLDKPFELDIKDPPASAPQ
jgi:hypothetical protein